MTEQDLKKLERSLTASALKAQKYYVRGMIGHTESEQGFFSLESIPVHNPIQGTNTLLAVFIEDVGLLAKRNEDLELYAKSLEEQLKTLKDEKEREFINMNRKFDDLEQRVKDLEIFTLD